MTAIALIDYGAGNLRSVRNALVAAGAEDVAVTADPAVVASADRIVLPGVGAFAACMNGLSAIDGLIGAMEQRVRGEGAPFLGICVGNHFVHAVDVAATSSHGETFVAAVAKDNIVGVQYHPEKSQAYGLATLERFLAWRP